MTEIKYTAQDIKAAAIGVGFSPGKSESVKRKDYQELDRALLVGTFPSPLEPLARAPERGRPGRVRKAVGAVAAAGALFVGVAGLHDRLDNGVPTSGETNTYTVQPGDTAEGIAKLVEGIHDGEAHNEDVRPLMDDIMKQANLDNKPGLQPGEEIQLPASSDIYADIEGVQLTHK